MKRSARIVAICGAALLFICLLWVVAPKLWPDTESRCSVKIEDDLFSIGMESMNETRKEIYTLTKGDAIDVYVVYIAGELDSSITDSNGNTIYEGHNPEMDSFRVSITEADEYTISVTGKQAEGSISFRILRNEE